MGNHYKRVKDKTGLVKKWKLKITDWHYANVYIWKDYDSMCDNVVEDEGTFKRGMYTACFLGMETIYVYGELFIPKMYGELHFVQEDYGVGTVAHEIMHLVLAWIEDHDIEDNEEICLLVGNLNTRFWLSHIKAFDV